MIQQHMARFMLHFIDFLQDDCNKVLPRLQRYRKRWEQGPRALLLSSCCVPLGNEVTLEWAW